ncbi:hypothetical protein [Acetobacter vaccinii]|nr:hypothetical protein [Acetobacter vaccinii]
MKTDIHQSVAVCLAVGTALVAVVYMQADMFSLSSFAEATSSLFRT